jgi:peptide/nickel transport system substrate-binding protein
MVRTVKSFTKIETARIAALLVLAALLGAGVEAAMAAEQMLTIGMGKVGDIGTDPTVDSIISPGIGGAQDYHYYTHYSPLIALDKDDNIVPWMAESYDISDDHRTITFHLRTGVKFADGTLLNASILKFNFDRIITYGWKDRVGPNGTMARLNPFIYYDYSEAPNDDTFKIHFSQGWLNVARDLSTSKYYSCFINPLDVNPVWDIKGTLRSDSKYDGLGPYYVDESESIPKEKIVLIKRPSWRDDMNFHKPKLNKIVLTNIADPQTAIMALEKGNIDYVCRYWNPSLDSLRALDKNPKIAIKTRPSVQTYYIAVAYWKEPFNGTEGILLRKALNYALDREKIAEGAFYGYATPASDTMYISSQSRDISECCNKGYDYDLDKAKQLFAEAGWKDTDGDGVLDKNGKALKDLNLLVTSSTDLAWMKDVAILVQSQLKDIGIRTIVKTLDWNTYIESSKNGDYDLRLSYNFGRTQSINSQFANFNTGGLIKNHYENLNGTLEKAAANIKSAKSTDELDKYICQVCNILFDEAGTVPLVHPMEYAVMNSKVKGFELGADYKYDHEEECWID